MKTLRQQIKTMFLVLMITLVGHMVGQSQNMVGQLDKQPPSLNSTDSGPILFNQMDNIGTGYMISHKFTTTTSNDLTCAAADDFDVPTGESWDLYSIGIAGAYWAGNPGGGDTVNVFILNDNNGLPGDTLYEYINHTDMFIEEFPFGDVIGTFFEIYLPSTITLTEGTYWVSVQMVADANGPGQWGWSENLYDASFYGVEWHWINPKDGWDMGAVNWMPASILVGPWLTWELAFALYGEPSENDLAVLSITSPDDYFNSPPTEEQEVTVLIKNEGSEPQTGFDVMYNFNGTEVTENIGSVTLEFNETYEFTFTQKVYLSTPGAYNLSTSTMLSGDQNPDNDEQSIVITVFDPTVYSMPSQEVETITVCSGTFADAGGLNGNLIVDDWGTLIIYPATAGAKIRLDFIQFDIKFSDFWIYDGETLSAPELGYWENDQNPGTITAGYQNTTGALTIRFEAQGWTPFEAPGWAANISCHMPVPDDFEVMGIHLSHPSVFENDYVTAYATLKNVGTSILEKDVTFTANGVEFATVSSGMVEPSDTVVVEAMWNPNLEGDYEIIATIPDDGGNYNNSASMMQHVFPFDLFCEGFELPLFPPDGWSQSGTAWTHNTYSPAVGNGHAYLWVEYGLFDTLITPKLHIEAGDIISFYSYSSAWWQGELDLCWIDGETGVASLIQPVAIPYIAYQYFEIDVSVAAGNNYLGFVGKYNPEGGFGKVRLDEVCGMGIEIFYNQDDLKAYTLSGNTTPEKDIATTLEIDIKNIGSEFQSGSEYTVRLMRGGVELMSYAGQDINPKEVLTFTLDYTFPYSGLYNCYVEVEFADDQDQSNNVSSSLNVYVQQEGTIQVPIGPGNDYESNWFYPIITQPTGLYSQTLYLAEDVGDPNTITGIMYDYRYNENYPVYDIPITFWMSETDEVDMSDSLEAANNYDLVYDGTVDFYPGYHSVYIPLDFVYSYQGGNLMVTSYKDYTENWLGSSTIKTSHVADTMVRYYNSYENGKPIDPYDQQSLDSVYFHQKTEYANVMFFKLDLEDLYCKPQTLNGTIDGDYIDGVSFGEIENQGTGSQGGPAYNNYTSMSANCERDRAYELTIQAETSGTDGSIAAWIDFNGDKDFDDEGEQIVHITSPESSQEITFLVNIPDDAALGLTLLRIRNSSDGDLFASCAAVDYGETEDYGINITETIQIYNPVPEFSTTLLEEGNVELNWIVPENPGKANTEGFEKSSWPPQGGWEVKQSTTLDGTLTDPAGDTWMQYNEDMDYVYNGAFSALSPSSAMDFNWLITPEVQLYGNDDINFMLNYSSDPSGYSKFYVLVYADEAWTTILEYTDDVTMYNDFEERVTVGLNDYAGKVVKLAFVSQYNNAYPIALDDIVLKGADASDKSVSGIVGYEIYKNEDLFMTIDDPSIIAASDVLTETENYIYCIYAMYNDDEKSEEVCDEAFYLAPLTPPLNVNASADVNEVKVLWTAPDGGMQRFVDDFENYNANEQVACQNPEGWTTWTLDPCGTNDPFVTTDQPYSGDNSVAIQYDADLLYLTDELVTQGKYSYNFRMYVKNGYNGYFNVLQDHDLTIGSLWGLQAFFDVNGIGTLDAGGYGTATFLYDYDEWMYMEVIIDLDTDWAKFSINGEAIHEWQWSAGLGGGGGWLTFEGGDFYSWNANNACKYYMDDFQILQLYDGEEDLNYNVYKDGSFQENVTTTEYQDSNVSAGFHDYCVSAVYDEGQSEQACDWVSMISAPENFTAMVENENDVVCSWDAVSGTGFLGYYVYRDEVVVSDMLTTTEWTDENLEGGAFTYYVTAVFEENESLPSNMVPVVILISPTNLVGTIAGEDIELEWDGVGNVIAGNLVELYQHDDTPANGLYQWFDVGYGVVFDISAYEGATIESVDFHHSSYEVTGTWNYMFHVVDMTTYEEIDFAGPFETTGDDIWEFDIDLGSLPSTSNLIGIFLEPMSNEPQDAYPVLSMDEQLNGNSVTVSLDDYSMSNPEDGDFLLNLWIFAPVDKKLVKAPKIYVDNSGNTNGRNPFTPVIGEIEVSQNEKSSKELVGYKVYYAFNQADFDFHEYVIDTTYTHTGMAAVNGLHRYYVTSTYEEGESGPSNIEEVLIIGIENASIGSDFVYPNPFTTDVNVKLDQEIKTVKVINAHGQVVFEKEQLNTSNLQINLENQPTGIYNLRIETQDGWTNHKMIKK